MSTKGLGSMKTPPGVPKVIEMRADLTANDGLRVVASMPSMYGIADTSAGPNVRLCELACQEALETLRHYLRKELLDWLTPP